MQDFTSKQAHRTRKLIQDKVYSSSPLFQHFFFKYPGTHQDKAEDRLHFII